MAEWYNSQNPRIPSGWYDEGSGRLLSTNRNDPQFSMSFQDRTAAERGQNLASIGVPDYTGPLSFGAREMGGGENAIWGIDPATGKEVPVFKSGNNAVAGGGAFFSLPDLMKKYGSLEAILNATGREGRLFDIAGWGTSPSNDTFSGKDGLRDLATIAAMAAPVVGAAVAAPAAATSGAAGGTAGATGAGLAELGGGLTVDAFGNVASGAAGAGSAGAGIGGGLAVDEFGNVIASGAGSGATGIGGGLGVDAFGNVTGSAAPATAGTAAAGGMGSLLPTLGRIAPAALGVLGASKQTGALEGLANRYAEYGAPSRARYEASMTPGFDPSTIPGYSGAVDTASKSVLAKLSASGGNPFGNPGGLIDAQKQVIAGTALPAVQEYQRLNAGTGFGSTLNAAGGFGQNAIGAQGNIYNAIGAGINDLVNPPQTLAQQLADLKRSGLFSNNSLA